jgi:hypothetical protein
MIYQNFSFNKVKNVFIEKYFLRPRGQPNGL